jgi:2-polyprenyl-6-methoxyphenol hydroxylase-like FAD-dependent oxidoreductase
MNMVDADVLIVGYGPVGQTLALLLGNAGHSVLVVERWPAPYARPRAVHFDDEIARVFAAAGVGAAVMDVTEPASEYEWQNADGKTLIRFEWSGDGPSGWPTANMFAQPDLERVLADSIDHRPSVRVLRGRRVVQLVDHGDQVEATIQHEAGDVATFRTRYVVGCDGANSFVREHLQTSMTDFGFFYDWLILDVVPMDRHEWRPMNLQICDPVRPRTVVSGGPGRRRWEFMRLPHESIDELNTEETAWRLLADWNLTRENATLERHTVYTFQARWANTWRAGRVLIAGDAAHLMPPFAGQGMCSGIRDAANLAWKLDLVLTGVAEDPLLDSYGSERSQHVRHATGMSTELGNVICLTEPSAVAARDETMLKAEGRPEVALPPVPPPVLGDGALFTGTDGAAIPPAGQLSTQGHVADAEGRVGRFDDLVGTGFVVLATADPTPALTPPVRRTMAQLKIHVVQIVPPGDHIRATEGVRRMADIDDHYLPSMRDAQIEVMIVRPDFYIFGAAASVSDLPHLVEQLHVKLHLAA